MADFSLTAGRTLVIDDYEVFNVGDQSGDQDIILKVDGTEEDRDSGVSVGADARQTGELTWDTTANDGGSSYTITVESDDDSDTATVQVDQQATLDDNFVVTINSTNSPVAEGDTLDVTAEVTNNGNDIGTQDIVLDIDNAEKDRYADLTLAASETRTITLNWTTSDDDAGDYTATVSSQDDTDTQSVSIILTNVDIRATVYRDSDDSQLAQATGTDTDSSGALVDGGIGLYQRGKAFTNGYQIYYDSIETASGTTIDDVEDGDTSEYSKATSGSLNPDSVITASQTRSYDGSYSIEFDDSGNPGENLTATSIPGDGLNYYPERGDTVIFYLNYNNGPNNRKDRVYIAAQDNVTDGSTEKEPDNSYKIELDTRNNQDELLVTATGQSFTDGTDTFAYENEAGNWLRVEVEWGV